MWIASVITSVFLEDDDKLIFLWDFGVVFILHLYLGILITIENNDVRMYIGWVGGVSLTLSL